MTFPPAPQFVPTPQFHPSLNGETGLIMVYRADEQNGTVATYEILAREASTIGKTQAPAVLVQFPAVMLFRPLTKMVHVVLNGSVGPSADRESGIFFAPSLMPGQKYQVAVRACVEVLILSTEINSVELFAYTATKINISDNFMNYFITLTEESFTENH